jgi:hypothetical protein
MFSVCSRYWEYMLIIPFRCVDVLFNLSEKEKRRRKGEEREQEMEKKKGNWGRLRLFAASRRKEHMCSHNYVWLSLLLIKAIL